MRHAPVEPALRKVLPWLAADQPDIYNAYQQSQRPRVQKQMTAASYVVSCIGHKPRKALFVGIYKVSDYRPVVSMSSGQCRLARNSSD
jgi:hypothetical protein